MHIICATLNAKYIHTNLAIRYLKAYAQPEFDITISEYTIKDPTISVVMDLIQQKPNVIGFSCYIWNIEETIKVISILKKVNPDIQIVLGGPEVSYDVKEWMERIPEVDYIVINEGEKTFKTLLERIKNNTAVDDIFGLAFRKNGEIIIRLPLEKIDLKTIPSPYRFKEDQSSLAKRIVYIETSRGCPFSCQFCLSSIEVGVRYFDKEVIKEDIRYLMKNGAKTIKFVDRTFNISRAYAMEMFSFLIEEHQPGVVFQFEITGDIMRPEVIDYLNQHAPKGLFRFEIGVQSTNEQTNEIIQRKQNWEKLTNTVTRVKQGGKIIQHLDLIAGLPEEDYDSFSKTFNDVFALQPEELQLGFLKMLRGTGLRLRAKEYGYVSMDYAPYEILKNNCLSFEDVIRIKEVEDILEKYWNDHRMDVTMNYVTFILFSDPFRFFQQFGSYWSEKGWSRIGHQLEDLFTRLDEFLETHYPHEKSIWNGLLKYDYLHGHTQKPNKIWWKEASKRDDALLKKAFHSSIKDILIDHGVNEQTIRKHSVHFTTNFDLTHYLNHQEIRLIDCDYVVVYPPGANENYMVRL